MHKKLVNEAILEVSFRTEGPILIKAGESGGLDPSLPSMEFVRTRGQVFLPGSSLKGVIRSHGERIVRTLQAESSDGKGACNPLARQTSCSDRLERLDKLYRLNQVDKISQLDQLERDPLDRKKGLTSKEKHKKSCFICRMFGNTVIASRILFADAMPEDASKIRLEERNGVAIDRIFGSVAHGPFNYEVVTEGSFRTMIVLKNFTLSQFTLLGLTLRDIGQGRVPIGFGKSRGLGRVSVEWKRLEVRYPLAVIKGQSETTHLQGVGKLAGEEGYGFPANDEVSLPAGMTLQDDGWGTLHLVAEGSDAVQALFRETVPRWREEVMSG